MLTIQVIMLRLLHRWLPTRGQSMRVPDTPGLTDTGIPQDPDTHGVLATGPAPLMLARSGLDPGITVIDTTAATGAAKLYCPSVDGGTRPLILR